MSCQGLYADVRHLNDTLSYVNKDMAKLTALQKEYDMYKTSLANNLIISIWGESDNLLFNIKELPFQPLQVVQIYLDTATYDEIEREVKVTLEAQLGLIGGTMGLLTGFSILSGVEIVYFVAKFFLSLKTNRMKWDRWNI